MLTYQDLLKAQENNAKMVDFVHRAIVEHRTTKFYKDAAVATEYFRKRNKTIVEFQKMLYTVTGKAIPDNVSANYKLRSTFFNRFLIQQNQYLLGNGITWTEESTKEKLGSDFETQVEVAGEKALVGGVSFGFWNYDHLEVFSILEFVPLWDEENGALRAGVRFWQIAPNKPMRATLYEEDGYTDFMWKTGEEPKILHEKRGYVEVVKSAPADEEKIYEFTNYDGFPIIPLWANKEHQSEMEGHREMIDCYDLIKSGFANNVDEASYIYWAIQNGGGMDDIDLANFVDRMRKVHASIVEGEGATATAHTIDAPHASRESILSILRNDLYEDFMALDTRIIAGGATTATQIRAAYEPLNSKTDRYESCVFDFLKALLAIAGIEDTPTFTRSVIINEEEEISMVLSAAQFLTSEYVTKKVLTVLGDADQIESVLENMAAEEQKQAMIMAQTEVE